MKRSEQWSRTLWCVKIHTGTDTHTHTHTLTHSYLCSGDPDLVPVYPHTPYLRLGSLPRLGGVSGLVYHGLLPHLDPYRGRVESSRRVWQPLAGEGMDGGGRRSFLNVLAKMYLMS